MDDPTKDTIPRSAVEYCLRKETVSTNPEKYKTHEKFIDYMNDPNISEFGHWMHSNGFNCALVSIAVDLDKIPSVTPSAQLAQDLTKGCTDTISRQAAIDELTEYGNGRAVYISVEEAVRRIEQLPPEQPDHIGEVTEMVGDAVSRKGVLRLLNAVPSEEFATKAMLISGVNALPSAQPGWIPCKTRKPEKSGLYLVTKQQKTGEIQLATAHYNTAFDEWSGNGNFKKVLAWQPLPSPWRGGQDGD